MSSKPAVLGILSALQSTTNERDGLYSKETAPLEADSCLSKAYLIARAHFGELNIFLLKKSTCL